ncbi:homocysteine S-methyltransferase 2 isoform X1 [Nicotiana tomentosiformis]|uniref:homocysteine S-methyltransferase 2 isoform X1 n=1 Tax=Nicotiana tomentosiformis TaxID=4098 RepID=UPI00051B7C11|nr:homocysteine S-methyltransferase 2-like isoform X1 [Nicotiana tomentosiformis]
MSTVDANAQSSSSLIKDFLHKCGGVAVIDGGFATELERHGADLNDPLWSAKCLLTDPHLVRAVHLDYLEAGADIILSSSYQATIQGFKAKGYSLEESESLLKRSVEIACEARDVYYTRCCKSSSDHSTDGKVLKQRPILVAASVGSYGAYLADGSEYSGEYGDAIDLKFLKDFHRRRVQLLAESGADLIAFETVPNKLEAQAFVELLEEEDIKTPAWLSFNSKDGINVVSGDSLSECAAIGESCGKVLAVGINCTPPRFILDLIRSINQVTTKPILIYPNSGESYDGDRKEWVRNTGIADEDFVPYVNKWCEAGASLVGGCCRTTPNTIREIHHALSSRRTV